MLDQLFKMKLAQQLDELDETIYIYRALIVHVSKIFDRYDVDVYNNFGVSGSVFDIAYVDEMSSIEAIEKSIASVDYYYKNKEN